MCTVLSCTGALKPFMNFWDKVAFDDIKQIILRSKKYLKNIQYVKKAAKILTRCFDDEDFRKKARAGT